MLFSVTQLRLRPGGRKSSRILLENSGSAIFGRSPECDVELADLEIGLQHLKIYYRDDGNLFVELLDGRSVSLNGRLVDGERVPLQVGDVLGFNDWTITIADDPDAGQKVLQVERAEQVKDPSILADRQAAFNTSRALPSSRLMAWAGAIVVTIFCLFIPWYVAAHDADELFGISVENADTIWSSGDLSHMHANLENDCGSCHEEGFQSVRDETCVSCHFDLRNHAPAADMAQSQPDLSGWDAQLQNIADAAGRPAGRCADCHTEHNPRHLVVLQDGAICSDCHVDLTARLPETDLLNVSDFALDHPQFRPTLMQVAGVNGPETFRVSLDDNPQENSGLKYPHKLHIDGPAVLKQVADLGDDYGWGDELVCADCPTPDAANVLFEPVSMTENCAMCHDLTFEIEDDGYRRTLRHGEPEEVIASMEDFYLAKALANVREAASLNTDRRRPGRAAMNRAINQREMAFRTAGLRTADKVAAIFSEGGACYDCHVITPPAEGDDPLAYQVEPVMVTDRFLPKGQFDHASHEIGNLDCISCHRADISNEASDVLLPTIESCQTCHGGQHSEDLLPSTCNTCHDYHDGPHSELMMSADDIVRRDIFLFEN